MKRQASAIWNGDLKSGSGTMTGGSGAFSDLAFSFKTRFEDAPGTNPEELIAAAHAGCFSMAFSNELAGAGLSPESVRTAAEVQLDMTDEGPSISRIHLACKAKVPGADEAKIRAVSEKAKAGCPVSKVLNAEITLDLDVET